jgi:hypothetical protein
VQNVIKSFVRERDGAWRCIEAAELTLPSGRIQVAAGTRFIRGIPYMGVDLARLLEEQYERIRSTS